MAHMTAGQGIWKMSLRTRQILNVLALFILAGAVLVLRVTVPAQPAAPVVYKTAGDLGIGLMSQHQLACHILDNCEKVEALRLNDLRGAQALAKRNELAARFVSRWSPWRDIAKLANRQHAEITGPNIGGFDANETITIWQRKLHPTLPAGLNLEDFDRGYLGLVSASSDNTSHDMRFPLATPATQASMIRKLVSQLKAKMAEADKKYAAAKVIEATTGDKVAVKAARAYLCRLAADWDYLFTNRQPNTLIGPVEFSAKERKLLLDSLRYLGEANGLFENAHGGKVDPAAPIKYPPIPRTRPAPISGAGYFFFKGLDKIFQFCYN